MHFCSMVKNDRKHHCLVYACSFDVCLCELVFTCRLVMVCRDKSKGEYRGVSSPPPLKMCHFAGKKQQCNVFLQGNLLDPGLFDQLMLLEKGCGEVSTGHTSDTSQK